MVVIYAQHWAESDANPDPEAVHKLQQTYGIEKKEAIHLMLSNAYTKSKRVVYKESNNTYDINTH